MKRVNKVNLDGPKPGKSYNLNLDLSMSPIPQQSMLEVQDASFGGVSMYEDPGPRVSTMKLPSVDMHNPLASKICRRQEQNANPFASTQSNLFDVVESMGNDVSGINEFIFPLHKSRAVKEPTRHDFSSVKKPRHKYEAQKRHQVGKYQKNRSFMDTEKPILHELLDQARPRHHITPSNTRYKCANTTLNKSALDTEKPLVAPSQHNWDKDDWYDPLKDNKDDSKKPNIDGYSVREV